MCYTRQIVLVRRSLESKQDSRGKCFRPPLGRMGQGHRPSLITPVRACDQWTNSPGMQKNVGAIPPLPPCLRLRVPTTFRMEMPPGRAAKRVVNPLEKRRKSETNAVSIGRGPPGDRARARGRTSATGQGDGALAQGEKYGRLLLFLSSYRPIDLHLLVCVSTVEPICCIIRK